ncbi:MAG: ring canal kelch-like protein, partial [Myxococcota bacterium]|nr:ring canal kelch-like protein [Myxococcota bacterium]
MPDLTPPVVTRSPFVGSREARSVAPSSGAWLAFVAALLVCLGAGSAWAQSFGLSNLDFNGNGSVAQSTSLEFGPDGRLYVLQLNGTIDVLTIQRNGPDDYVVTASEEILLVKNIPNHDDDGTPNADDKREATGITVVGTALNPVIYATSSDARVGGPSGDKDLDTNSGVITRLTWNGTTWDAVDLVRGLPRSEENHATNGLEFVTVNGTDYLIVCSGGHTNAGSPSTNFAWHTEYALSAAVLSVDLTALELLPVLNDGARDYVYDLPTVDDPTRANANGIGDPNAAGYDGVDVNDPWGGNDGLNQAKIVPGGPVQIFSPGYRNTYDLVVTESGAVYLTENGANGGWGGFPENEGPGGTTTNNFRVGEPGSTGPDPVDGEAKVNNKDHLHLLTNDISTYAWGSFYGGHPTPIRANPAGAGLFTRGIHSSDVGDTNGNGFEDDWFRTQNFDPNGSGEAADASKALPADWPPVPIGLANPVEGDFRNPGGSNPDGPVDDIITIWANNTNGIDEYTASNFGGAMQGDLIAGKSGGTLHRVQLNPDGSLDTLTEDWNSNLGGNPLGVTANGDADPFPGTIWVGTFSSNIVVLEPQDLGSCPLPGEPGYDPNADNDLDGYTNEDEDQNGTDLCNGGSQPNDFDKVAGAPLVSDLNDPDDDGDGIDDSVDVMQLGNPAVGGTDAFPLPVDNELFSDNPVLQGYLGLGFTGLMNNGAANPNWLDWIDQPDAGPNPNDVLGGAVGAMTMQMTDGTAYGLFNDQEKGFQYGVDVPGTGAFTVQGRLLNLGAGFQLYPTGGDAELGIFLGDGTQSNYIELLISGDGVEAFQELGDTPQTSLFDPIAVPNRPTGSVEFELRVDADSGLVEALYGFDGSSLVSLGTIVAGGAVLSAIQTPGTPVMVGLIGSSYAAG